jgi:5-methylcytosine-specific restriction enzyme subunit McrC
MRRWREVVAAFQDIGRRVPTERELDRLVFGRHETRYRAAVEWVRWIRRLQSPELRAGGSAAPGLLFDMNVLFQNAVARFIRSSMSSTRYDLREQDGGEALAILLSSPTKAFRLRPDILVRSPKGVAAIADTKWKLIRVGRGGYLMPEDSDVYQMHAYASAYRCLHVALVYPWHAGLTNSRETVFELPPTPGGRPRLSVMCLDVGDGGFVLKRGALRDVMPPEISRRVVR